MKKQFPLESLLKEQCIHRSEVRADGRLATARTNEPWCVSICTANDEFGGLMRIPYPAAVVSDSERSNL